MADQALSNAVAQADAPARAAMETLTELRATTLEGLIAKARVVGR